MIAAEIPGMSRKVNALQTVDEKLPCGAMYEYWCSSDRIPSTIRLNHE